MSQLESIRAFVDGAMSDAERAKFQAEIAANPELAQLVESYRLLADLPEETPARTTSFDDLPLRSMPRIVPWAVAATLLLAVGFAFLPEEPVVPGPIALNAVPREAPQLLEVPAWPRALIDYRSSNDEELLWLDDATEAEEIAHTSGRPLLVFVHHEQCPYCRKYAAGPFRDEDIRGRAEDFVLLKVSVERMPMWVRRAMPKGWPVIAVFDANGRRLDAVTGLKPTAELSAWMEDARAGLDEFRFHPWSALRTAAQQLIDADRSDDPAHRLAQWRAIEALDAGILSDAARAHRLAMEAQASAALNAARDADPKKAQNILAIAEAELRGTDYAADLARIRKHIAQHGAFPDLE